MWIELRQYDTLGLVLRTQVCYDKIGFGASENILSTMTQT